MRPKRIFGKLIQLSHLPFRLWAAFARGWILRGKTGSVPCSFPGAQELISVPLREFYETYWFFCESKQGLQEMSFFLDRLGKGDVLYDIGAFHGAYGAAAKSVLGDAIEVHLFEPLIENLRRIDEISKLNRFQKFSLVAKAVGAGKSVSGSVNPDDGMLRHVSNGEEIEFPSTSIDAYCSSSTRPPSVVKIDVEGFEFDVLEGALETFRKYRPRLWIEVHPAFLSAHGKHWGDLIESLKLSGYAVTFFDDFNLPTKDMAFHIWCEP